MALAMNEPAGGNPGNEDIADRIASQFQSRFLRNYTRSKLRTDPLYRAVAERLLNTTLPVVDVGCGVGLTAFYLRESGFDAPITGIDHDARKVAAAQRLAARYSGLAFVRGDARELPAIAASYLLLDVLHYFDDAEQARILDHVARWVPPGGMVIVRDGIDDGSWRYRATWAMEKVARGIRWLQADRLNFPRRESLVAAFPSFNAEVLPLWGSTPFNNYLFVFRRSGSGTTKE